MIFEKYFWGFQEYFQNGPDSYKFVQIWGKCRLFLQRFPPPPIYYNPPNLKSLQKFPTPPAYYTPPAITVGRVHVLSFVVHKKVGLKIRVFQ